MPQMAEVVLSRNVLTRTAKLKQTERLHTIDINYSFDTTFSHP